MWKVVGTSVVGTSHIKIGSPCQDSSDYLRSEIAGEPVLIIAASDGAGSAAFSHLGSQETVRCLIRQAASCKTPLANLTREDLLGWFSNALSALESLSARHQCETRDLACTSLLAVLGSAHAVFAQIGDGAWIAEKECVFGAVTWPQKGEFANETKFLTSPKALETLQFQFCSCGLDAVAGFTDGIEGLALHLSSKSVHAPFFQQMFGVLGVSEDETSLLPPLISFLSSDSINERTDDDKTLVLACRVTNLLTADELR